MPRWMGWLWKAAVLLGCIAYQLFVHCAIVDGESRYVRAALTLLPPVAVACWVVRYAKHKLAWTLFLFVAGGAIYAIERAAQLGLAAAYGIPHAAIYLSLFWLFARTLSAGQEPLITRFARRVHGTLPPHMEAYTRRLTLAWSLFFIAQVMTSIALFTLATLDTWSLFVNVLSFPLVPLMFAVEYAYRVTRHRDFPHASIMKGVRTFTEHTSVADKVEARW